MCHMDELTPEKIRVLKNLDRLRMEGEGHGTLRIEVRAGSVTLIKREHSEEVKKTLDK
jgi:hypothetical protein